jgi:hypothetical protein
MHIYSHIKAYKMARVLGSIFVPKKEERLLTKPEIIKVMRITGKTIYELENYYFEECVWMIPDEDEYADTVFNEAGIYFCVYFCDLALYNRQDGDVVDYDESIEINKLSERVLVHMILSGKNTTGFSRIIGA